VGNSPSNEAIPQIRRHVSRMGLAVVAGCCCFWLWIGTPIIIHAYTTDFLCYYIGGTIVRQGHFGDLYRSAAQMRVQERVAPSVKEPRPYVRPPWFAIVLAPITFLPLVYAYAVWVAIMLTLLLSTWIWSLAQFGEYALLIAALFLPTNLGLFFGQDSAVMLAVLCLFIAFSTRGSPFLSGMVLGIGLMKPHLLLLFPVWLLVQRRWRTLAGFAAVAATVSSMAILLLGASGIAEYLDLLSYGQTALSYSPNKMLNIYSVPINLGLESRALNALLAVMIVVVSVFGLSRAHSWRALGIASAGSLLISPHVFGYDAALLLPSIWLVLKNSANRASRYSGLVLSMPITFLLSLAPRPFTCIPVLAVLSFLISLVVDGTEENVVAA
jgi:hypothetical protein